ncbi:sulfotransferase family protein [Flavobacteriaceae bacterium 14752]|uniref:sulfotransferase family protein n=1 Tax=Mesohalobacter salilacus TaxID=2491711 RepID=UPI000F640102|nr:hypothetical protein EIG84_03380 [Flavobacteriaceae bacterium 14752]
MNKPNTFLIGVQKAATTSVYNWLSKHPQVCAPIAMKDIAFFTRPMYYRDKGYDYLLKHYQNCGDIKKVKLQCSVHYIFFEESIKRIKDFNPESKFILILRQPMQRAVSSYLYARRFGEENLNFKEALENEQSRMESEDFVTKSGCTYINHGFYARQIKIFLKYFDKSSLKILFYEDIKNDSKKTIKDIYNFLSIDQGFIPEFKKHNKSGKVKSKFIQNLLFGDNALKKYLVNQVLPKIISNETKAKLRWKIINMNVSNKKEDIDIDKTLIKKYNLLFHDDINELEKITNRDLSSWKNTPDIV